MTSSNPLHGRPTFLPEGIKPGTVRRGQQTIERMTDAITPSGTNRWTTNYSHTNGKDYSKVTVYVDKTKDISASSKVPLAVRVNVHSSVTGDWWFRVAFDQSPPYFKLVGYTEGFGNDGPRLRRTDMFELYKFLPATAKIELRVAQNMIAIQYGRARTRGGGMFISFVDTMIDNLFDPDTTLSARTMRSLKGAGRAASRGAEYMSRMRPAKSAKQKSFNYAGMRHMKPGITGALRAVYDVYMEDRI